MSTRLPFFVYGTLCPGERNFRRFLPGRIAARLPALLPGAVLYPGPGFPYAVRVPGQQDHQVSGVLLYPVSSAYHTVLDALDLLEGYTPGGTDNHYERLRSTVTLRDGTSVGCWLYVAAPAVAERLRATSVPLPDGTWRGSAAPAAHHR